MPFIQVVCTYPRTRKPPSPFPRPRPPWYIRGHIHMSIRTYMYIGKYTTFIQHPSIHYRALCHVSSAEPGPSQSCLASYITGLHIYIGIGISKLLYMCWLWMYPAIGMYPTPHTHNSMHPELFSSESKGLTPLPVHRSSFIVHRRGLTTRYTYVPSIHVVHPVSFLPTLTYRTVPTHQLLTYLLTYLLTSYSTNLPMYLPTYLPTHLSQGPLPDT